MKTLERWLEWGGVKRDAVFLAASIGALLVRFIAPTLLGFDTAWIAVILCGTPILLEAFLGLITRFDIKADLLVSLALVASLFIGETFAAAEVAVIMQFGSLLEELTVHRSRSGMERLVRMTPRTARLLDTQGEHMVPAESARPGDTLRVLPGETVPADGVILEGNTSVDESMLTGESVPVDKAPGDTVSGGTVNRFGAFDMRVETSPENSALQRMIRLVDSADVGKAKIVGLADRWAAWVVVIALLTAIVTWFVTGEILRSVTVLVVFCPCAMVLSTPTAIVAAIGNLTRRGVLVREGDALERLAKVDHLAFDKTGTLTQGRPGVAVVRSFDELLNDEQVYALLAAAEMRSEHPLGKAVVRDYETTGLPLPPEARDFAMEPGRGVTATVNGHAVVCGNADMLREQNIPVSDEAASFALWMMQEGCTLIYVASDGKCVGVAALSDALRPDAWSTVESIRRANVHPVLLTGDNEAAARSAAAQLEIRDYRAACLPEDKLSYVREAQNVGAAVCMVGDGVNDAPALKAAWVSVAMGAMGSDIAVEAADIALVGNEIRPLGQLLALSRHMMRTIHANLAFSMGLNFLAIALAVTGALSLVVGALVHNAGSLLVIVSSARLLWWGKE